MVLTALTIFGKRELRQGKTSPRLGRAKTQKMIKRSSLHSQSTFTIYA